jgi:hypothetical protein
MVVGIGIWIQHLKTDVQLQLIQTVIKQAKAAAKIKHKTI